MLPEPPVAAELRIRPLSPADGPLLREGFAALSARTRQLRWGRPSVDAEGAIGWVHELGGSTHVAVGACFQGDNHPVGVVRYVLGDGEAEVAATVVDAWQGRGIGTLLARALVEEARERGVQELHAWIASENRCATRLARRAGAGLPSHRGGGLLEFVIPVSADHV